MISKLNAGLVQPKDRNEWAIYILITHLSVITCWICNSSLWCTAASAWQEYPLEWSPTTGSNEWDIDSGPHEDTLLSEKTNHTHNYYKQWFHTDKSSWIMYIYIDSLQRILKGGDGKISVLSFFEYVLLLPGVQNLNDVISELFYSLQTLHVYPSA